MTGPSPLFFKRNSWPLFAGLKPLFWWHLPWFQSQMWIPCLCASCACLQGFYPGFETRTDVTRISKQGYQWPSKKDKYPPRIFLKKIVKPAVDLRFPRGIFPYRLKLRSVSCEGALWLCCLLNKENDIFLRVLSWCVYFQKEGVKTFKNWNIWIFFQ